MNVTHRSPFKTAVSAILGFLLCFSMLTFGCLPAYASNPTDERSSDVIVDENPTATESADEITTQSTPGELTPGWTKMDGCEWRITNGVMTLRPLGDKTEGTLGSVDYDFQMYIWDAEEVYLDGKIIATGSLSSFFDYGSKLKAIYGLENLDTSNAVNMSRMFCNCKSLQSLDLSSFDTSKVTNMESMFSGCESLQSLDLSSFDTSKVTNMMSMFGYCKSLQSLDLSSFDTTNVNRHDYFTSTTNSLKKFSLGEKFTFRPSPGSLGPWYNSQGQSFKLAEIPLGVKDTYVNDLSLLEVIEPLDSASVQFANETYFYSFGTALEPKPVVSLGENVLQESIDYTLNYKDNHNAGTATVTISGIGNYSGEITSTFEITPASINDASISDIANQTYSEKAVEPKPTVKVDSTTLNEGTDYTISYLNNINAGTATMSITGIGNYSGSITKQFQIVKPANEENDNNTGSSEGDGNNTGSSEGNGSNTGNTTQPNNPGSSSGGNLSEVIIQPNNPGDQVVQIPTVSGTWKKSGSKWWFSYDAATKAKQNKAWPKNEWVIIGGKRYHFDGNGFMHAGWKSLSNKWYYFGSASDGAMKTGWVKSGGKWYYMNSEGIMQTGKQTIGNTYYFFNSSGAMRTGWIQDGKNWYYSTFNGAVGGWKKVSGKWYYMDKASKIMLTGFKTIDKAVYYFNGSGAMLTGWQKIGGNYYHFNSSGAMSTNKWAGNYWLSENGVMATNAWVDGGKYYVDGNGAWVKGKTI